MLQSVHGAPWARHAGCQGLPIKAESTACREPGAPHPVHQAQVDVRIERLAGRLHLAAQHRDAAADVQRAAPRDARRQALHRAAAALLLARGRDVVQALWM